jgi:hypothetical protein
MSIEAAIDKNTAALAEHTKAMTDLQASIDSLRDQLLGGDAARPQKEAKPPKEAGKPAKETKAPKATGVDPKIMADAAQLAVAYAGEEAARKVVKEAGGVEQFVDIPPEKSAAVLAGWVEAIREPMTTTLRSVFATDALKEVISAANGGTYVKLGDIPAVERVAVYQALHDKYTEATSTNADEEI